MTSQTFNPKFNRRTLVTGAAALGALQIASPFVIAARGETAIRIGMVDPLTGAYAAPAGNEVMGARLAVEQINAKGGILGRQVELLVEDSANDVGTGVQKARKLIERDQVNFMIGDVNSAVAAAIAQVTAEKKILHIVSGGHTDSITGKDCKWNVFRVCNTTRMEANSVSSVLFSKYGKKWHFITPDYAFGHTLYDACTDNLKKLGGSVTGNELTPLGTTDFSAYLIKARAANPDVMILVVQGSDMINCLKQWCSSASTSRSMSPERSRSWNRLPRCHRKRASGSGCSNGTGSSRASPASTSSSPTFARSIAARYPPHGTGSAMYRP